MIKNRTYKSRTIAVFGLEILNKIKLTVIALTTTSGLIWVVNLPYPMIRLPIAKVAPILLLPSFISMDYHYREAIDSVGQADQLVNQGTSLADIERGSEKVQEAKNHLQNLPVWFLGYYPQRYCSFFSCSWQFTLDEFQSARQRVATMDAKVFQEKNAFVSLDKAEQSLNSAKQQYQNAQEKEKALASIQAAIDTLEQIPTQTLAGRIAQTKLIAYKRDFGNSITKTENSNQTGNLIEAAKIFGQQAAQLSQNPPHAAQEWEQIGNLWEEAISKLKNIKVGDSDYLQAQTLIVTYQTNLGIIQTRSKAEGDSQQVLKQANNEIQQLIADPPSDRNQLRGRIEAIINLLKTVQPGTTAYNQAQDLLVSAQKKLQH